MKLLILTTDLTVKDWGTINDKLEYITNVLNNGTVNWQVEMQEYYGLVMIENNRLERQWFKELVNQYFKKGYDMVAFHMSDKQRKTWGIKPTLRGSNLSGPEEYGDMYFWSDEHTLREGLPQFIQTLLHEICHEYYQKTGFQDITHIWHANNPDITNLIKGFNWAYYQPVRQKLKRIKLLLEKVLELTKEYVSRIKNI